MDNSLGNKILIIAPAWIGDAVMAISLYQSIKLQDPNCKITIVAPIATADLHHCMPSIDQVIPIELTRGKLELKKRMHFAKAMRSAQFDIAYVLPNSWKSALIPYFAKIPIRIGWLGEQRYGLLTIKQKLDKNKLPLMVQRYAALAHLDSSSWDKNNYPIPRMIASNLAQKQQAKQIIAICPGAAYGPSKRWPVEHFAQVAKYAVEHDMSVWLFGSKQDLSACHEINLFTNSRCNDLSGKTSLIEMINLLAATDQVIANDSGLMHVAAALDKKVIAIYGSTSSTKAPPLSNKADIFSLEDLYCKPCGKRECPLKGDENLQCLRKIAPEAIISKLK